MTTITLGPEDGPFVAAIVTIRSWNRGLGVGGTNRFRALLTGHVAERIAFPIMFDPLGLLGRKDF